jgi:hypothetical protein
VAVCRAATDPFVAGCDPFVTDTDPENPVLASTFTTLYVFHEQGSGSG